MLRLLSAVVAFLVASFLHPALAQTIAAQPRGVYATINLSPMQEMIRRLAPGYGSDYRVAVKEVTNDPGAHMPPVFYALANALAEDHAEEAIFWYHVGRLRAVYDALRCQDKSANAGLLDLRTRLNKHLVNAQFYRRERLVRIAEKAIDWDSKNPRKYDHRWIALYGKVAVTSPGTDPGEITVPESEWPEILKRVHEAHLKSVQDFANEKKGN